MSAIVCIHGIGQYRIGQDELRAKWVKHLNAILESPLQQALESITATPFYALSRQEINHLGPEALGQSTTDEEYSFLLANLAAYASEDGHLEETRLGPPALLPPALIRMLAKIDSRFGAGRGILAVAALREAYVYLYKDRSRVNEIVGRLITQNTRLVIGHSLGAVIAADILTKNPLRSNIELITLGSPLSWPSVSKALSAPPAPWLTWTNVLNEWDVVTAAVPLDPPIVNLRISGHKADPHALQNYLTDQKVIDAIRPILLQLVQE